MTGKLLMEKYKLDINWCLVPELYRCIGTTRSGKHFDLRLPCGVEAFIKAMEEAVPGCEKPMHTFIDLAEECSAAYDYFNDHMLDGVDKNGFTYVDEGLFMKKYPNFLRMAEYPFNKVASEDGNAGRRH
jgi:hypothetical protein